MDVTAIQGGRPACLAAPSVESTTTVRFPAGALSLEWKVARPGVNPSASVLTQGATL